MELGREVLEDDVLDVLDPLAPVLKSLGSFGHDTNHNYCYKFNLELLQNILKFLNIKLPYGVLGFWGFGVLGGFLSCQL